MDIKISRHDATHPNIKLTGRFDAFETEALRAHIDECLTNGSSTLTIDLSDVHFIDSSGLAELVRAMKQCREAGGELHLYQLSDAVRVILELTRLDIAFEITGKSE